MNPGPDQPSHGHEYPPLENTPPAPDAYAPVDYPTNTGQPPPAHPGSYSDPYAAPYAGAPTEFPYPAPPQVGFPPPGYPQAGYPQGSFPPPPMAGAPYPQYPGGYPGYDPYRLPQSAGTNGKAIASLVTSLAGLVFCGLPSIVGIVLGVIAMRETKRTGQEGHGMALAGVIVGALAVAGWLLYGVVIIIAIAVSSTPTYY